VFGVAYAHTRAGTAPLAGLPLNVAGFRESGSLLGINVVTDAEGRYAVEGLLREYVQIGIGPQDVYLSPCSVRRWLRDPEPLNIHVVARTELLTNGVPATLRPLRDLYSSTDVVSGFVTERTSTGVRPVVAATVEHLYSWDTDGPTGFTLTNAEGFYEVCQYYDDYAQEVRARKAGYGTVARSIGAGLRIDFELTRE
jgi:hypothetical protein